MMLKNKEVRKLICLELIILFIGILLVSINNRRLINSYKEEIIDNNAYIINTLIEKYPEYSAVEVEGGFKLMHSEETKQEINRLKERRKEFINKINGNGTYNNDEKINVRRYEPYNYQNNYQNYDNVR